MLGDPHLKNMFLKFVFVNMTIILIFEISRIFFCNNEITLFPTVKMSQTLVKTSLHMEKDAGYKASRCTAQQINGSKRYSPMKHLKKIKSKQQSITKYFEKSRTNKHAVKQQPQRNQFILNYKQMTTALRKISNQLRLETLFEILPNFEAFPIGIERQYPCIKATPVTDDYLTNKKYDDPCHWNKIHHQEQKQIVVWCRPPKTDHHFIEQCIEILQKRQNKGYVAVLENNVTNMMYQKAIAHVFLTIWEHRFVKIAIFYFDFSHKD